MASGSGSGSGGGSVGNSMAIKTAAATAATTTGFRVGYDNSQVTARTQERVTSQLRAVLMAESSPLLPIPPLLAIIAQYVVQSLTVTTILGVGVNETRALRLRGRTPEPIPAPTPQFVAGDSILSYWKLHRSGKPYSSVVRSVNETKASAVGDDPNREITYLVHYIDGDVDPACPERNMYHVPPIPNAGPSPPMRVYTPTECVFWRPPALAAATSTAAGSDAGESSFLIYADFRETLVAAIDLQTFAVRVLASSDDLGVAPSLIPTEPDGPFGLALEPHSNSLFVTSRMRNTIHRLRLPQRTDTGSASSAAALVWSGSEANSAAALTSKLRLLSGVVTSSDGRYLYATRPDLFRVDRFELPAPNAWDHPTSPAPKLSAPKSIAHDSESIAIALASREAQLRFAGPIEDDREPSHGGTRTKRPTAAERNSLWRPLGIEFDRFTAEPDSVMYITATNFSMNSGVKPVPHMPLRRLVLATGELTPIHFESPASPFAVEELAVNRVISVAPNTLFVTGTGSDSATGNRTDGVFVVNLKTLTAERFAGCTSLALNDRGYANGTVLTGALGATFRLPLGLAYDRNSLLDGADCLYVCDSDNSAIRCIAGSLHSQLNL